MTKLNYTDSAAFKQTNSFFVKKNTNLYYYCTLFNNKEHLGYISIIIALLHVSDLFW